MTFLSVSRKAVLLASVLVATVVGPLPAGADGEVVGYSGTARANLAFVEMNVPLPVLLLGVPGATSDISGEPVATALGMPIDPGFVGLFFFEDVMKNFGQVPQYAAACANPQGAIQTEQSFGGPDGSPAGTAQASCPSVDHSRSLVTGAGVLDEASGLSVAGGRSLAETRRSPDGVFESAATTALGEVKVGPLTIRNIEYRALVSATGRAGEGISTQSATIGAIEVDGQVIGGPVAMDDAQALLDAVNTALAESGIRLGVRSGRNLASADGAAVDAEATSLVVFLAPPFASGGGYTLTSALYLGRAHACLDLSLAGVSDTNDLSCLK